MAMRVYITAMGCEKGFGHSKVQAVLGFLLIPRFQFAQVILNPTSDLTSPHS